MHLEMHASADASLASPLLFVSHVLSGTLVGIVAGAAHFEPHRQGINKMMFIKDGHPVALEYILG
jgi:hypothetical protein